MDHGAFILARLSLVENGEIGMPDQRYPHWASLPGRERRACVQAIGRGRRSANKRLAWRIFLITTLVAILGPASFPQAHAGTASCSGEGALLIRVELLQEGFAGQTGERTTVTEDGCFTVDRLLNGEVISHLRSGRLGPDRMLSARAAIESANIAALPDRIGSPPPVNPAFVAVTYKGATKTLVAPAGTSLKGLEGLGKEPSEEPLARLARLALRVLELTGSELR